jgi:hypothetical protein
LSRSSIISFENTPNERLIHYYENIRQQAALDRPNREYAERLRDEMVSDGTTLAYRLAPALVTIFRAEGEETSDASGWLHSAAEVTGRPTRIGDCSTCLRTENRGVHFRKSQATRENH